MNVNKVFRYTAFTFLCLAIVAIILDIKVSGLAIYSPVEPTFDTQKIVIEQNDMLATSFALSRLPVLDYDLILKHLKQYMDLNDIHAGDFFEISFYPDSDSWFSFAYYPVGANKFYLIKKDKKGNITSSMKMLATDFITVVKGGIVEDNLWRQMRESGIDPNVISLFAEIFSGQIDLLADAQKGDAFKVLYEQEIVRKKNMVTNFRVVAVQYKTDRRTLNAVYFKSADEREFGYFDLRGRSVKREFLASPFTYRQLAPYFAKYGWFPISKYTLRNLSMEFVTRQGVPVVSVADGIVKSAFDNGDFGNQVVIVHKQDIESSYAHLDAFAPNIRAGMRVAQGQVIGYVGRTGFTDKTHLLFDVTQSGYRPLLFSNFAQLPTDTIDAASRTEFQELVKKYADFFDEPLNKDGAQ
ncbi:MAG: M23 family metallopeptidase [Elusimicrobiota bacterium]|jgi:murein DD-endopeptidase MepM/ murein hydrolase activator NlpD|nr:M23 family metallopeptidase [Elusimicrobiota bacterium]